jgi:hypothetical protein
MQVADFTQTHYFRVKQAHEIDQPLFLRLSGKGRARNQLLALFFKTD